ncbi:MAG: biotin--[acetyl-CoA-carboxylase] ligase [Candidatus Cloacimonadia bacterium]
MHSQFFPNIRLYRTVESTQHLAKQMLKQWIITENTALVAKRQTAGIGRRGSKWVSSPGGLWCSLVILEPDLTDNAAITIWAGNLVHRTILNFFPAAPLSIKWPNDVFYSDKKVAGILVTQGNYNSPHKNQPAVIIGIGININQKKFPPEISEVATSIRIETSKRTKIGKLLHVLLTEFGKSYPLYASKKLSMFIDYFNTYDYLRSRLIRISHNKREYIGRASGISDSGSLIVQLSDNTIREFVSVDKIDILH